MSEVLPTNDMPGKYPAGRGFDIVIFLYLLTGALGLALFALIQWASEGWAVLYVITMLTSAIGWAPGVFLIVVYRHLWRIALPAGILIACLGSLIAYGAMDDKTIALTTVFYVAAFLIGLEWAIGKLKKFKH